jgi:CheY-like chemotaxis protein
VWNLLSNAIKFTPAGGHVQVKLDRADSQARITITDTGEGIDPEFLPYVFERFQQADASKTRRHSGLGLGLTIVRHIVELHGGVVEAQSSGIGKGASFTVRLPLGAHATGSLPALPSEGALRKETLIITDSNILSGLRILTVDDEPDTRGMVKAALEQHGADVMTAPSAADAFEALPGFKPDVLVCDIGMPEEDGYSLIHRIRALQPEQGGNTPAIALTGYVRVEERTRALDAGFQMFVPKPVEVDELASAIANLVGRTNKGRSA